MSTMGMVGGFVGKIGGERNPRQKPGYAEVCEHITWRVGKCFRICAAPGPAMGGLHSSSGVASWWVLHVRRTLVNVRGQGDQGSSGQIL